MKIVVNDEFTIYVDRIEEAIFNSKEYLHITIMDNNVTNYKIADIKKIFKNFTGNLKIYSDDDELIDFDDTYNRLESINRELSDTVRNIRISITKSKITNLSPSPEKVTN